MEKITQLNTCIKLKTSVLAMYTAFRAAGLLIYNFILHFCFWGGGVNFYGSLQPYWCMVKFPTVFLSETILNSKKM